MSDEVFIYESNMVFGPFRKSRIWHIEKSYLLKSLGSGIKIAEFIYLVTGSTKTICIVEAKSSSPQPHNKNNFKLFIEEIKEKFCNTFNTFVAVNQRRNFNVRDTMPIKMKSLKICNVNFKFILVIYNHKKEWLQPINDELKKVLKPLVKTWALGPTSIKVINDAMAKSFCFIQK